MTHCTSSTLHFHPTLPVHLTSDAPRTSSDGGALLPRQVDERLGSPHELAVCIPDGRDPTRVVHSRLEQVRQRVYQIALGYEDCDDAHHLRGDPALLVACDKLPGDDTPLSSQPTLSRMENAVDGRCVRDMLHVLEQHYLDSFHEPPEVVVLDLDGTDDPTHGQRQLSFFHGHYDQHMYHPLLVFDGLSGQLITAILRPGNAHAARGAMGVPRGLIVALEQRFPKVRIVVRGDSGYCVPRLVRMLEELNTRLGDIDYLLGLAKNPAPLRKGAPVTTAANEQYAAGRRYVRHFGAFQYAAETWPHERHVVMKAERGDKGDNPRFIITSLTGFPPELLYDAYRERGQCENYIKDFKNALKADRLSCSNFWANFSRLPLHSAAYVLMHALRTEVGRRAPALATVRRDTLRPRLLKVAAHVTRSARRLWVRLPVTFPLAGLFMALARSLGADTS